MSRTSRRGSPLPAVLSALAGLFALLCLASLALGAGEVSPVQALSVLAGGGGDEARFVVEVLRLPRTALGVLVGLALGISGVVLQVATRNPLVEPGLMGVNAGAAFAVVLTLYLGGAAGIVPWIAVLGAFAGCMLVLVTTRLGQVADDPVRLVLAGVVFSGIINSASTLILLADQRSADEIRFWIVGALGGRPIETLYWAVPGIAAGVLALLPCVRALSALMLGEGVARGLGHRPERIQAAALAAVSVLVGVATAAAGPLVFVGLVVPFVARRLVGPSLPRCLAVAAVAGPCLVLAADIFSRLLIKPYELPVGVVIAFIGAPVLVAIVRTERLPRF
ncbi:Ferric enterobactin transport system permease protein FepD [Pigmentiphaga humi]|uniref:Ferric enterobactin transport system permease protein FepD n=1 Tax=Pigmentiphaga humi TaxID=2478468 RepID=A0A3P4B821_9BURK|nr:iron ABC transporter permease [Pigmentiphaga humi]VCU72467.1 Ferric enterobactin transport system permease protein FepD [Pigmentiphaga humi]